MILKMKVFRVAKRLCRQPYRGAVTIIPTFILLFLMVCTIRLYSIEKRLKTKEILTVLGRDRNTFRSVLPDVDTVIYQPTRLCELEGKDTNAVIVVMSLPERRYRREVIRQTWGANGRRVNMMLFFLVGKPKSGDYSALEQEAGRYGDLIVENLDENYYGLTTKSLRMLKWFQKNCSASPFIIKVDDDVYVNLRLLNEILAKLPQDFVIGGRLLIGRTPNFRNPFTKWYTPPEMWSVYSKPPPYISGGLYVIKGSLVPKILNASYQVPLYHFEDVFISGMVISQKLQARLHGISGIKDPKFPRISYLIEYYFGWKTVDRTIVSFHTDGDMDLVRRIHQDVESMQPYSVKS